MNPDVTFALEIAQAAGDLLANRPDSLELDTKSTPTDVVTHMDKLSEQLLVNKITEQRPNDGILGEEGTDVASTSGRMWVIDPLDGTVNYLYKLPFWAVSIGLIDAVTGDGLVGVVAAPQLGKTWVGHKGHGSFVISEGNIEPLAVSACATIDRALIGTGFGYSDVRRASQGRVLSALLPGLRDIRRMGSCAIDLCMVAEGNLDAYFERGVNPWDHAGGGVIAREAGAAVSGLWGATEGSEMLVAANPTLAQLLVSELESLNADTD